MGLKINIIPETEKLEVIFKDKKQLLPFQKQDPLKPAERNEQNVIPVSACCS